MGRPRFNHHEGGMEQIIGKTSSSLDTEVVLPCPAGHNLAVWSSVNAEHCDKCLTWLPIGANLYGCQTCDYNECQKCHDGRKRVLAQRCGVQKGSLSPRASISDSDEGCPEFGRQLEITRRGHCVIAQADMTTQEQEHGGNA